MSSRPKVLDIFAGAGGLSLGFEQAGFDVVAAVELDPIHAAIHSYNLPNCTTICADATKITGKEILQAAGTNIDVVVGGAPCQGFSLIGQRALDDPRNQLVKHFLRIVVETDPNVFVLENVKGLTLGKHRKFLEEIVAASQDCGYEIALPWQVLNAKNYGVPQDRERLFLVGVKRGMPLPDYPTPAPKTVTCGDALDDLPDAERYESLLTSDSVRTTAIQQNVEQLSEYALAMRCANDKGWQYGYRREWDSGLLTSSLRTDHTDISRSRFANTAPGTVEPISRFFKLAKDGVSNTLRAGTDSARGAFTSPRPIHYRYDRCITVREMARLHGFPDWFRFHQTKWHGARQIGNAVPPPLALAVAQSILYDTFEIKPRKKRRTLKLKSDSLLRLDMKKASNYWGIEIPIGKRDKKSGAKKRKQEDIQRELTLTE